MEEIYIPLKSTNNEYDIAINAKANNIKTVKIIKT